MLLCSYNPPPTPHGPDSFPFIGKGTSVDRLCAAVPGCHSCSGLNDLLRTFECELHDMGKEATLRLDVHLVFPSVIPRTFPAVSDYSATDLIDTRIPTVLRNRLHAARLARR
jgi:hypothetical protein